MSVRRSTAGRELWRSDGTVAGTVQVVDIAPGNTPSDPKMFTRMGDHLYFHASAYAGAQQLYRSSSEGSTAIVTTSSPSFSVHPNPNNGSFRLCEDAIWLNTEVRFDLIDATGRRLPLRIEGPIRSGQPTMTVEGSVAAGWYALRITAPDGRTAHVPMIVE